MRILSLGLTLLLVVGIYTVQAVNENTLLLYLPFDDGAGKIPKMPLATKIKPASKVI